MGKCSYLCTVKRTATYLLMGLLRAQDTVPLPYLEDWNTDPAALWDGTHDGIPCPQGSYAYYWHVRDAVDYNHTSAGIITLIR